MTLNYNKMTEIFKFAKGFDDYMISNFGRVKSLKRNKQSILRPGKLPSGHLYVNLSEYGKKYIKYVHILVAEKFLNHNTCEHRLVVDHIDNDPSNNHVNNLQLISQRENTSKDRFRQNYSSKYVGVSWNKLAKKWKVKIYNNGKQEHLGFFKNEYNAHLAYQKRLKELNNK